MNNLPENENNTVESEEFSTVFSAPSEHKQQTPKNKKSRLKRALALILALTILVGGTVAVVKLIPKKEVETPTEEKEISVLNCEDETIKNVVVKNKNGSFKFLWKTVTEQPTEEGGEPYETTVWRLDGVDESLTDSNIISDFVDNLTRISAIREITTKNEAQCGLDKPKAEAVLNLEKRKVTISIGDKSPDNMGNYIKVSTSDKIYLVNDEVGDGLEFDPLDLASTEMEQPLNLGDEYSDYYLENGLAKFDKLTVSSVNMDSEMVFEQNTEERLTAYIPHYVVKPLKRPAENVTNLFAIYSTGFYIDGAYSYDIKPSTIKKFGLDKPDFVLSATFDDYTYTYKFKAQKDGYYAYIGDNSKNVRKVSTQNCGFLTSDETFFYNKKVFITPLDGLKNMTFVTTNKEYSFDITLSPTEENDKTFIIECDGKTYKSENFQNYFQYLVSLESMDFAVEKTNKKPELSIVYTYNDKELGPTTIDFVKLSATRYQYSVDGVPMGKLGSASYNKVIKLLDKLVAGKTITIN
jgi:hypothetical protein